MDNKLEIVLTARDITGKTFNTVQSRVSRLTDAVFSLNGAFAGLAAGGVLYKAMDEFTAFDQGLVGVQKTTELTDAQVEELGKTIEDMALRVPVATTRLLEIAESAGQLGVEGSKNIEVFTETIAKLETASDIKGAEAAKSLARLMNVTGENISEVDTLGSVIVALGNNMAATESEIVKLATEVGQATSVFEVSSAETTAFAAAMKSMGVRAELGGSVVGRAMRAIESAIHEGGESFEYLQHVTGKTGGELERTFETDSTRVFKSWIEGMGELIDNGRSAEKVFGRFGLQGEEVMKVLPAMATKSGLLAEALDIANKETENATALNQEAMAASESFASQMTMTVNAVDRIASRIGEGLAPEIVEVTEKFRDWVDENDELIQQRMPEKIGDIAEAAGGVLEKLSGMKALYDAVPDEVVSAGGMGLAGRMILGAGAGKWVFTLSLLNDSLKSVNLDLGHLKDTYRQGGEAFQNLFDVFSGKRDWNTGELIGDAALKNLEGASDRVNGLTFEIGRGTEGWDLYAGGARKGGEALKDFSDSVSEYGKAHGGFTEISDDFYDSAEKENSALEKLTEKYQAKITALQMTADQYEIYQAVQKAGVDANSTEAEQLRGLISKYQRLFEVRENAQRWDRESVAPVGIGGSRSGEDDEWAKQAMASHDFSGSIRDQGGAMSKMEDQPFWSKFLEQGESTFDQMGNAFDGWASSYSRTLNDMLWESEVTFDGILESFGKMVTEMLIQSAMADVTGSLFGGGNNSGGTGTDTGGLVNTAVNAVMSAWSYHDGGTVGRDGTPIMAPAALWNDAPRLHSGLKADEYPAILQRGEEVKSRRDVQAESNRRERQPELKAKIINVMDPSVVGDYMATDEGEQMVMNIVQKNQG